jgi:dihydrolipoamide dehydrogenase
MIQAAETVEAKHIIVATGSKPAVPPIPGMDLPAVIDSDGALALTELPGSIMVLGAGAIGCEWSLIFARFGCKVTLVEMLPTVLPREDTDVSSVVAKALKAEGIDIHTGATITSVKQVAGGVQVEWSGAAGGSAVVDKVLVGAGRKPLTDGLNLDAAGVETNARGCINVDDWGQTNVDSVLAIGDVTGQALLAHVASRQGVVAVEALAGLDPQPVRPECIPSVTYTDPEVASVGLTEAAALDLNKAVSTGVFRFSANGRAVAQGVEVGLVKAVADAGSGRMLGMHMVGPHAGELLGEAVLALEMEMTLGEFASVIRAHPTLSEALGDAALAALGRSH